MIPDPNNIMQIQRNNWQIVNCTTPANYYHALRRQVLCCAVLCCAVLCSNHSESWWVTHTVLCGVQMHRDFRKPLIVMSPKALLRHADATSSLAEMTDATRFQQVLPDPATDLVAPAAIKRVVFCSGKGAPCLALPCPALPCPALPLYHLALLFHSLDSNT